MAFTTDTAAKILNQLLRGVSVSWPATVYVSLHTGDPGNTGANEVAGGSYTRLPCSFDVPDGKHTQNTSILDFTGMPAATVSHAGIWGAQTDGVFWWGNELLVQKTVGSGDTLELGAGEVDITLD